MNTGLVRVTYFTKRWNRPASVLFRRKINMIIGLSGKIGAGKDTAADFIIEKYPEFNRAAFALNIKKMVATMTGTTLEENLTREGKASTPPGFPCTLSRMQQLIGQNMREVVCKDVWVTSLLNSINGATVVTDVRYPNEVVAIQKAGGIVIRLTRETGDYFFDGRNRGHESETALDDFEGFDHIIENNGTLEELRSKLQTIIMSTSSD